MTDLAIIGAGPAGISAGIYAARDGFSVKIFEKAVIGGIATTSNFVENYPGFEGISGADLAKKMRKQAEKFGVEFLYGEISEISQGENSVKMRVDGEIFEAKTALLATGNSYRKLNLPREEEFFGRGIHSCAVCDGAICAGQEIIAVGGGNSAITEALFLSRFSKVKLLVRSEIRAQEILQKRLEKAVEEGKIEVFLGAEIQEFLTEKTEFGEKISGAKIRQKTDSGEKFFELSASAIFEFIGLIPNTKFLENSPVELNEFGEIKVNEKSQTSASRIFAAGDAVENAEKQIVIAAASGAKAAIEISKFLRE